MDHPTLYALVVLTLLTLGSVGWLAAKMRGQKQKTDARLAILERAAFPAAQAGKPDVENETDVRLRRLATEQHVLEERVDELDEVHAIAVARIAELERKAGSAWSAFMDLVARGPARLRR